MELFAMSPILSVSLLTGAVSTQLQLGTGGNLRSSAEVRQVGGGKEAKCEHLGRRRKEDAKRLVQTKMKDQGSGITVHIFSVLYHS